MIYCDTSLLIPILVSEVHSGSVRDWLGRQDRAALAISGWVSAEVASALAKKQRMGELSPSQRASAWRTWSDAFASRIETISIEATDYDRAAKLVDTGSRGLRAADALHLAIAERHGFRMATLDSDLASAASDIGLAVPDVLASP